MTKVETASKPSVSQRTPVVKALDRLLADTYTLALKTQNFHWNVAGPHFHDLHVLFEGQYDELAAAVDDLAERIRALKAPAPGSFAAFSALTGIPEAEGGEGAQDMARLLAEGHEEASRAARAVIDAASDDPVTADLATVRSAAHDKAAWMLRATIS
jgi:starvation-inducible DNA-binding protein